MVVLRQANNVKYAQFLEPGQTLTVTAEVLKMGEGETKLKAYGTVAGRIIVERTAYFDAVQSGQLGSRVRVHRYCHPKRSAISLPYFTSPGWKFGNLKRTAGDFLRHQFTRSENNVKVRPQLASNPNNLRPAPMRFEGKTALVTGGSRGIGRAASSRLVRRGRGGVRLSEQSAGGRGTGGRVAVGAGQGPSFAGRRAAICSVPTR